MYVCHSNEHLSLPTLLDKNSVCKILTRVIMRQKLRPLIMSSAGFKHETLD